jgi:hypothetical protein
LIFMLQQQIWPNFQRNIHSLEGLCFLILKGKKKTSFTSYCEGGFRKGEDHCKETGGTKKPVKESLYYSRQYLQASDEMYNGKAMMCITDKYKYVRSLYEQNEFYDLIRDPKEQRNEINNMAYQKEICELKEKMLMYMMDTADVVPYQKDARMKKDFLWVMSGIR